MSKYSIRELKTEDVEIWNQIVEGSENGTIFHKYEWLKAAEIASNTKFHPLVVVKSEQEIVCLLPVFFEKKLSFRIIHSPPPECAIPSLGPVFNHSSDKQNKIESERNQVIEIFDEFITEKFHPDYIRIITEIEDVRPFTWLNFNANPLYTYRLNLEKGEKNIFNNFDKRIRSRVRKVEKIDDEVKIVDCTIDELIADLNKRYNQKGRKFKLNEKYLQNLSEKFSPSNLKIQALQINSEKVSKFALLKYDDTVKFWLGGANLDKLQDGANEYIHWNNIKTGISEKYNFYERIGANTKHLCENKSKYDFRPSVMYTLEKWTTKGKIGLFIYGKLKRNKNIQS